MGPVDLSGQDRGDQSSLSLFAAGLRTIHARAGHFGAPVVLEHEGLHQVVATVLPPWRLLLNSDGIGTKVEVAERTSRYDTLGFDLVAMLVDDAVRFGAEPLSMSNILDIHRADEGVVAALGRGLEAAALAAGVAVVGGEVAELGERIAGRGPSGGLNWAGTLLSVIAAGDEITGGELHAGQAVIALGEEGLRCNGFTLARRILGATFGDEWHTAAAPKGQLFGEALLTPSRLYAPALVAIRKRALADGEQQPRLAAVVHVTGGGIPGKLGRIFAARGLGADLHDLFEPPDFVLALQRHGHVDDAAAYRAWCFGQGMLLVTSDPGPMLTALAVRGVPAKLAGEVTGAPRLRIRSKGAHSPGELLTFDLQGKGAF